MQTFRMIFRKKGDSKYLSHLDLMRCFTRAVKRTGFKAWYTEGYNPHLYLMFISPLSLGFESDYEAVDIRLDDNADTKEFISRINEALPMGVEVVTISQAVCNYKDLGYSSWEILIRNKDHIVNKEMIFKFLDQDKILVIKKSKKGVERQEDIKQYIKRLTVVEDEDDLTIYADFVTNLSVSLNPQLFLDSFWKVASIIDIPDVRITRKMLLDIHGNKME